MPGYNLGVLTAAAAAGAAYCVIRGGAAQRVRIREIGISTNAATLASIGLGHPANTPAPTTSALAQPNDPADGVSICNIDTAWSTAPTAPTIFQRRIVLPATAGAGWIWTWPDDEPLILDKTAGSAQQIVLWNFGAAAGPILSVYIVTKE